MTEKQKFASLMFLQDFDAAYQILNSFETNQIDEIVISISFDSESILVYTFLCYCITKDARPDRFHYLASQVLSLSLNIYNGANEAGCFHIKQAIRLAPSNLDYKQFALSFYFLPGQPLDRNTALAIATEILEVEPTNQTALMVL